MRCSVRRAKQRACRGFNLACPVRWALLATPPRAHSAPSVRLKLELMQMAVRRAKRCAALAFNLPGKFLVFREFNR